MTALLALGIASVPCIVSVLIIAWPQKHKAVYTRLNREILKR